jgi:hypothetical protein
VGRAVGNELYQAPWFVQQLQQLVDKLQVGLLIAAADIIYFSELAFLDDSVKSPTVVAYKDPVPDVKAIPIDRDWFLLQGIGDS